MTWRFRSVYSYAGVSFLGSYWFGLVWFGWLVGFESLQVTYVCMHKVVT